MFARILAFILITCCLSLITPSVFAQTPATTSSPLNTKYDIQNTTSPLPPTVSPISPLYTDLLVNNLFHTFSCLAIGQSVIGQPCLSYQITQNAQGMVQSVPVLSQVNTSGGALGATTSLIGMLYTNPPVRTADYIGSLGEQFGIVKTANAQVVGSGAKVLNPILNLWTVSRNIAYVFMIVIFVVIGIMIMFRHKINPQTVITAQAALPGLVIGLIMITFSFFLAGLISDMAFVGTNVVGYYFTAAQGPTALADPTRLNLAQKLSGSNTLNILGSFTGIIDPRDVAGFSSMVFESLGGEAKKAVGILTFYLSSQFISPLVPNDLLATNPWGLLIKPVASLFVGGAAMFQSSNLLGQLLGFAAALALVYQMLKLLFRLITAWLTIIFLTITAPFQFLFSALPGRQGIATGWILNMLGNILIFPAIIAILYFVAFILGDKYTNICAKDAFGKCLIQISSSNKINSDGFISPVYAENGNNVIGTNAFPLFGGMNLSFINVLLAFGALLALPTIPDIIVRSVGKAGQAGQMIGQEIMGGARFGQGYAQKTYQAGLGTAQQALEGLTGKSTIDASGKLVLTQQGFLRRGTGTIGAPEAATPGQWHIPGTNKYYGGNKPPKP